MGETLDRASTGHRLTVKDILGGPEVRARLAGMGLLPGVVVQVVRRGPLGGPVLVEIGGSRVALGRAVASMVLVAS